MSSRLEHDSQAACQLPPPPPSPPTLASFSGRTAGDDMVGPTGEEEEDEEARRLGCKGNESSWTSLNNTHILLWPV